MVVLEGRRKQHRGVQRANDHRCGFEGIEGRFHDAALNGVAQTTGPLGFVEHHQSTGAEDRVHAGLRINGISVPTSMTSTSTPSSAKVEAACKAR